MKASRDAGGSLALCWRKCWISPSIEPYTSFLFGLTIFESANVSIGPPGMRSMSCSMILADCFISSTRTRYRA